MYGTDPRTFWCRTIEIGQGVSTGWAKKFEFFTILRLYVHISQKLLKIEAYKQRSEKRFISPPSNCRMCLDPSSDAIPVFSISPIVLHIDLD